jgi:tRNA pseudouridine65 synthase
MSDPLAIIYQDEYLVAINKPSGLLTHRSWIDKQETRFAIQMLRDQINHYVYPVHRLDKPTSGVLLFALSQETARTLSAQISSHELCKQYLAVVRGYCDTSGVIDYPLKEVPDKMTDRRARTDKAAQTAVTHYETLDQVELAYPVGKYATSRYSLLRLYPRTGRKHQLRRHLKHIHHPIIGDTRYGRGEHNQFFRQQFNCHRLLLHASKLALRHPESGQKQTIKAPLDKDFLALLNTLGFKCL